MKSSLWIAVTLHAISMPLSAIHPNLVVTDPSGITWSAYSRAAVQKAKTRFKVLSGASMGLIAISVAALVHKKSVERKDRVGNSPEACVIDNNSLENKNDMKHTAITQRAWYGLGAGIMLACFSRARLGYLNSIIRRSVEPTFKTSSEVFKQLQLEPFDTTPDAFYWRRCPDSKVWSPE